MNCQMIFKRKEMKYLLSPEQYRNFRERISEYMSEDKYGLHTICSVYFDSDDDRIIRSSLTKPVYKEKLRLRSYGVPSGDDYTVFLELKKKYKGIVYKRRIPLALSEAEDYINTGSHSGKDSQIFREIDYFRDFYHAYPKAMIAYDRIAMYGNEDENLRLTFDFNVRGRYDRPDLKYGDLGTAIIPEGYALMELKITGSMPMFLANILSELSIYPMSFSKYGQFYMMKGEALCSQVS